MQYRHFGKLDIKPSLLGFGAMRLPVIDGDTGKIDLEKAISMVRYGIDNGINYVDTAFGYHDGTSEDFVKMALADGYREKVYLATKNPSWLIEEHGDWEKHLDIQLKRLEVEQIDFYLQHALNLERFNKLKELNFFESAQKAKEDGKIKYFGFSFHDTYEAFEEILNSYDWDFCQIQYNYLDEEYQAGTKGLELAASKNIGVIIMEPLRGGKLADKMPEDIREEFKRMPREKSNVEWGLRWVANHPEVSLLLSGMHTMEQVIENVEICSKEDIVPNKSLTNEEVEIIKDIANIWNERTLVNCTACDYCMPCPFGVDIPGNFAAYNTYGTAVGGAEMEAKKEYKRIDEAGHGASLCMECMECVSKCPQSIEIPGELINLRKVLE